jgi:hypothetical protein
MCIHQGYNSALCLLLPRQSSRQGRAMLKPFHRHDRAAKLAAGIHVHGWLALTRTGCRSPSESSSEQIARYQTWEVYCRCTHHDLLRPQTRCSQPVQQKGQGTALACPLTDHVHVTTTCGPTTSGHPVHTQQQLLSVSNLSFVTPAPCTHPFPQSPPTHMPCSRTCTRFPAAPTHPPPFFFSYRE